MTKKLRLALREFRSLTAAEGILITSLLLTLTGLLWIYDFRAGSKQNGKSNRRTSKCNREILQSARDFSRS
jgi:hypothetical protein